MLWMAEYEQIRDQYRAIGRRHRESAAELGAQRQFPYDFWRDVAEAGLFGAATRRHMKHGVFTYAAATHGLTLGSLDLGFNIATGVQTIMAIPILEKYAVPEVREAYLASAVAGKCVLAFAVTEPHGGTDAFHPATRLRQGLSGLYLDGAKWHVSNAPMADAIIVWCTDDVSGGMSAVLVDPSWPGVTRSAPLAPAGMRTSLVGSIEFDNVLIPETHVLGAGHGRDILRAVMAPERMLSSFGAIAVLDHLLDQMLVFSTDRHVMSKPIVSHQHIQRRITDVSVAKLTATALAHSTLDHYMRGENIDLEASALKLYAMQAGVDASIEAIKLFGSYGLQEEARLCQYVLDFLCGSVAGGTDEAQRMVMVRELLKRHRHRAQPVDRVVALDVFDGQVRAAHENGLAGAPLGAAVSIS